MAGRTFKKKKRKLVITHDGVFHADEVLAVAALKILFKDKIRILRTRRPELIARGDFALDVGRVYDSRNDRFDHHQPGGAGKRKNGVPYASFGLVWKKYGEKICGSRKVADRIDRSLVQIIDAYDNGLNPFQSKVANLTPYSISRLIAVQNPAWNEKPENNKIFWRTVQLAEKILRREIILAKAELQAENFVKRAYQKSGDKRIIILDKKYPWENVLTKLPTPKFVVFPYDDSVWGVKAVGKTRLDFKNRQSFPQAWAGKEGRELAEISGVPDAVFCHHGLFAATARTKNGAVELAKKAIRLGK